MGKKTPPKTPVDVRADVRRQMNPLLAALAAKGLVAAPTETPAAKPEPPAVRLARLLSEATTSGRLRGAAAVDAALDAAEALAQSKFPAAYREFVLAHGAAEIATQPPSRFLAPSAIDEATRRFWGAHRGLRALRAVRAVLDRAVIIADYKDDAAVAMLALEGKERGRVYVVAHDQDDEPSGAPFAEWLAALLEETEA